MAALKKHLFFLFSILILVSFGISDAYGDAIIDDGDPGTSHIGTWVASGGTTPYNGGSLWARDGATYIWNMSGQPAGTYEVSMWWSGYSSRAANIEVRITHRDGTSSVYINQQQNAGQWNSLGRYYFDGSGSVTIISATGSGLSTCADAVRFNEVAAVDEVIIDNRSVNTSRTGTWAVSGAPDPYDVDSVWSRGGSTFSWRFTPDQTGSYDLSMWWTAWDSRSTNIPVDIQNAGGTARVFINQKQNGGRWNLLGRYPFVAGTQYLITITAQSGPSSTCADAVRFSYAGSGNMAPVAVIDSIAPNPAPAGQTVALEGHGSDPDGTVVAYSWRSSIDGPLSTSASFTKSNLSSGTHTIFFRVQDNGGEWSSEATETLIVGSQQMAEHIYICLIYNWEDLRSRYVSLLQSIGAVKDGELWRYVRGGRTYVIHFADTMAEMKAALQTQGAHIILEGHSNYGLGAIFATSEELRSQVINNVLYVDDDRIFNYASPSVHVNVYYLRNSQSYPNWWPIFKDGSNAIMPYDYGDPRGNPAYNYYLTYQIPGDPTYYKVETAANSGVERFFGAGTEVWYSPTGAKPNPSNPDHLQYFIINTTPWSPSFDTNGSWTTTKSVDEYYGENYIYSAVGTGSDKAIWSFSIPTAGMYNVYAWWTSSSARPTNAPYTINHSSGSTTVPVNQRINGGKWNKLGSFYFQAGNYSVVLTDKADSGSVVADALRVEHVNNPSQVLKADFNARERFGTAPLEVDFDTENIGEVTGRLWEFGDGSQNTSRDSITHTYTKPGTYTVRYTVYGPLGSDTTTETGYIVVGTTTAPLKAEFDSGEAQEGAIPLATAFRDRSSGNITSWRWTFGDGGQSTEQNPSHTYTSPGIYTVGLTVTDNKGNRDTETKQSFVRAIIFDKNIDNVDYPKTHFGSKTMLYTRNPDIRKSDLRFARMMYDSCNSGNYFIDTFGRGIMFYTVNASGSGGSLLYLRNYLLGRSDQEIWQLLQAFDPVYDYYDFSKLPSQQ